MAQRVNMYGARRFGGRLTRQEEEIIDVSFESFRELPPSALEPGHKPDKRDGIVNADKLKEAFKSINATGDMHDIQMLLDDMDDTGSGNIDYLRWRAMMSRKFLGEEDDSSFSHVFAMLDDNKDGFIPLVELRRMLMQEGQAPLSEQEVDELLMFADSDSDGLVDYRDFLQWLSSPEAYNHQAQAKAKGPPAGAGVGSISPSLGPAKAGTSGSIPPTGAPGGPAVPGGKAPQSGAPPSGGKAPGGAPPPGSKAPAGSPPPGSKAPGGAPPPGSQVPAGMPPQGKAAPGGAPPAGANPPQPAGKAKAAQPKGKASAPMAPKAKAPAAAGGAAAEHPKLREMVSALETMGAAQPIDKAKAQKLLEQNAGDLDTAVAMYLS